MIDRVIRADAVIVGGGVAGMSAALATPGEVVLISKSRFGAGGSTPQAQGGVAVALAEGDSPGRHAADTVAVGGGINDGRAVEVLTTEGPARVHELIERGARFDRDPAGRLIFGREAGHSLHRIIHARGDATGAEIMRALSAAVLDDTAVIIHDHILALDLVVDDGRITGLVAAGPDGERVRYVTPAVILATGGVGRLYARTTNPVEVTGDGLAMAARAGARLIDLEFVQFHPTALATDLDPMPLVTEALRGAGAHLVDERGDRFMVGIHPDAELAPRDLVARAIWGLLENGHQAFLDATGAVGAAFPERYPTVFAAAGRVGLDPRAVPLPVSPAAHYFMGGVEVDEFGRSSVPGLWAVGEVAATGAHGANRLASNSLLEGLVFGARAAASVAGTLLPAPRTGGVAPIRVGEVPEVVEEVRSIMWQHAGLVRDEAGLAFAVARLTELELSLGAAAGQTANMVMAARLIAVAARARRESRGAHYRRDFPATGDPVRRAYAESSLATVA